MNGLVRVNGAAGVGERRGETALRLWGVGDTERQLYWSLRAQFSQSSVVMQLICVGCQVSFTMTPHVTCCICLEAVNVQFHTLFHQADYNSP